MELAQRLGWVGPEHGAACGMCEMWGACRTLLQHRNCPHSGVNKGSAPPDSPVTALGAEIILGSLTQHWKGRSLGRHQLDARQRQLHCRLHQLHNHGPAPAVIPVPEQRGCTPQPCRGPSPPAPRPCLVPRRRGAARSPRAGSTQAPGRLAGWERPAQNSRDHLPALEWQQLPRCLAGKEARLCLPRDLTALRPHWDNCISDRCSGARGQGLTHLPCPSPPADRSQTVESVLCCQTASVNRAWGQPWQHLSLIRGLRRSSRAGLAATQAV